MTSKGIQGLYVITDAKLMRVKSFKTKLRQALKGGAKVVQYRDKSAHHELRWQQAQQMVDLCKEYKAISIINDDVELAKVVGADGVHIGIEDGTLLDVRQQLGPDKIIGVSCYADLKRAIQSVKDSADYVAFGSIFPSLTKTQAKVAGLDVLRQAKQELTVPVVAIGGISLDNLSSVIASGADSIAVVSAVFGATGSDDSVQLAASTFSQSF